MKIQFMNHAPYYDVCVFGMALILVSGIFVSRSFGQNSGQPDGEAIYLTQCSSCHLPDGNGISGIFPPLRQVDWVTGDKGTLIRIVLDGVMGEFMVGNVVYNGAMPPWKTFLNDQEISALLTYIRAAWENDASAVTDEEVSLVRNNTSGRTQAWTAKELADHENQGIPGSSDLQFVPSDTTESN